MWQQRDHGIAIKPRPYGSTHVGEALLEILFEVALKGPGYLIVRWIRPKSEADPDGFLVVICGLAFWILVGLAIWAFATLFNAAEA